MSHSEPKVFVVVLNWNGKSVTSECLDSVRKVSYGAFEVILVDNGSKDGSQDFFKENYTWVRLIENGQNLGFTGGNNVGIRYALRNGADYVLLLNNDTVVDTAFLGELIRSAEADDGIGILNPKIYYYDHPKTIWYAGGKYPLLTGIPYHIGRKQIDKGQYDEQKEVSFINGCAFLIKRRVIEEIGFLDENLFIYSEDSDWCLRAMRAGYKAVYVPSSVIWHKEGVDSKKNKGEEFRLFLMTRNIMYVVYKNFAAQHFLIFLLFFCFRWVGYLSIKMLFFGHYKAIFSIYRGFMAFWPMRKMAVKGTR